MSGQRKIREFRAERVPRPQGFAPFVPPASIPLDVEVGCGAGLHPIRYAGSNPGRYLVAIEHTRTRFERFAGRLARHEGIGNLLAVHANAVGWITHCLPSESVDRYFFLYPNPWPKDESKRWYAMPFFRRVLETMKPGAVLSLATNELYYAEGAERFLIGEYGMSLERSGSYPGPARSHFEKKFLARGEPCLDLRFIKAMTRG